MSFWKGKEVLVTGASGFTGSHLCRELVNQGANVRGLVKELKLQRLKDLMGKVSIVQGNVMDLELLKSVCDDIDYAFHPAAIVPVKEAQENPQKAFEVNGIGSWNLASALVKAEVKKMLHISTCHIYGNQRCLPIDEKTLPNPQDVYAASKYSAEIFLQSLIAEGAPIVISRSFAFYGEGQGDQYLIPRIIIQLLKGEKPRLGSPKPSRDYSHITDIVKGYLTLLEKGEVGKIYHLSSQKETTVSEMYDLIAQAVGTKVEPEWYESFRKNDILRLYGTSIEAREFGWKPEVSLKERLKRTVEWFRCN